MAVKPYLQLIRLPNVFTAAADSLAGWLLVKGTFDEPGRWLPLMLASALFYAGGIALNDVLDLDVDRRERPGRPLPSGKVAMRTAWVFAVGQMVLGLVVSILFGTVKSWFVALGLIAAIVGYNAGLKRTIIGPVTMGSCRGLNLLLGMSGGDLTSYPILFIVAAAYTFFVEGITWVSRSEVDTGRRGPILRGMLCLTVGLGGFLVASCLPGRFPRIEGAESPFPLAGTALLAILAVLMGRKVAIAYQAAVPAKTQQAVKFAILSLVWLHVGLVLAVRGPLPAAAVAAFWLPAAYAGRWIYST